MQIGLGQIGPVEIGIKQVSPGEVALLQVGAIEVGPEQVGPGEVDPAQIGPGQVHCHAVGFFLFYAGGGGPLVTVGEDADQFVWRDDCAGGGFAGPGIFRGAFAGPKPRLPAAARGNRCLPKTRELTGPR